MNQTIDAIVVKAGLTSIGTTVTVAAGEAAGVIEQGLTLTQYSLIISIGCGILYFTKLFLEIFTMIEARIKKWRGK